VWIAAAQFHDLSAKFVRKRLTQVFALFAPGIQSDFKFEQIGRNLIGHIHPPEVMNQFALENKQKRAIGHDGLPKGDEYSLSVRLNAADGGLCRDCADTLLKSVAHRSHLL
jgi:hypothetical protein